MTKYLMVAVLVILLGACAVKPPVQEMAEARSAIERAQQLKSGGSQKAEQMLKSAEQSLKEAATAIDSKHYEAARRKAVEAKSKAQLAVRFRHSSSNQ